MSISAENSTMQGQQNEFSGALGARTGNKTDSRGCICALVDSSLTADIRTCSPWLMQHHHVLVSLFEVYLKDFLRYIGQTTSSSPPGKLSAFQILRWSKGMQNALVHQEEFLHGKGS